MTSKLPDAAVPSVDSESSRRPANAALAWMQLVRLPNVFTVLADVGAAFLLVAGGGSPAGRFALVLAAGVALYWAGMILNDLFDLEKDTAEKRQRPLVSGAISLSAAKLAGWGLLLLGVLLAAASGYIPDPNVSTTWMPAAVAVVLAVLIVAYNGPLKETPIAPAAMGGCRMLSFLLGAAPVLVVADGMPVVPRYVLGIAIGFGVYVMGITTIARDEAVGGHLINLRTGFAVILLGALLLAFAPGLSEPADRASWAIRPGSQFVLLIGLIVLPVAIRGFRAQFDPRPAAIGNTIRAGILTIIPLAASFALLGAGQFWAIAVFALVIPAIALSLRLQVT
ncbi:UbiA family prenyltransferase [Stieleria sp. TO1_6]|uniref:UbiA family prenyltransferase n=1 Tax=Stieleria tagensis TaxID=2956795 RepID=UPI00209BA920|nr:UbiA family prenyltransferase [Stieleria tagensis]MCO8125044.1 UbiA family prenyltransferase [Stieleria tagensis]